MTVKATCRRLRDDPFDSVRAPRARRYRVATCNSPARHHVASSEKRAHNHAGAARRLGGSGAALAEVTSLCDVIVAATIERG